MTWNKYEVLVKYDDGIGTHYTYTRFIEGETFERAKFYFNISHLFKSVISVSPITSILNV